MQSLLLLLLLLLLEVLLLLLLLLLLLCCCCCSSCSCSLFFVPCSLFLFLSLSASINPVLRFVLADIRRLRDQVLGRLVLCGSNRNICCSLLRSWQQPPDQPTSSYSPPRFRCGEPLAETPSLLNCKTRSNSHSVVLVDTSQCRGTPSPFPLFWANRPPWKNHTTLPANRHHACRPQCGRTQRADSERPPFHVCWCSQSARASHELYHRTGSQEL